ncbi:MAG: hypothetical protein QNI90_13960 [Dinoroseobacter sp.]|nr:hypothetical protein [Dinoroseobacter sp.]
MYTLMKPCKKRRALAGMVLSFLCPTQTMATVIGGEILQQTGEGNFVILDPSTGFDVGQDNFDTDHLYAFDEDQNIRLTAPIRVDIGGIEGQIPAGEVVASHYVFFDSFNGSHYAYVEFDAAILGVAALPATMDATDFLANTAVNYISTELRGLETGDYAWIDEENPNRLWVLWAGSSPGDYIRVFTALSPAAMM